MARPGTNYWVDVAIALGFVASALSGAVFLLPGDVSAGVLGVALGTWSNLHSWSSLLLIVGVGAHLALHWRWIVHMTCRQARRLLPATAPARPAIAVLVPAPARQGLSRRSFMALAGGGLLASGLLAGSGALFGRVLTSVGSAGDGAANGPGQPRDGSTSASVASAGASPTPRAEPEVIEIEPTARSGSPSFDSGGSSSSVACHRGSVNDPYPGQCRQYVDRNGDGICDLSVPGSGVGGEFGG